jgi:hypothetical protein
MHTPVHTHTHGATDLEAAIYDKTGIWGEPDISPRILQGHEASFGVIIASKPLAQVSFWRMGGGVQSRLRELLQRFQCEE